MATAIALGVTTIFAATDSNSPAARIPARNIEPQSRARVQHSSDTLSVNTEVHDIRSRMMTSPQPVNIHQQGRLLRVESQAIQLLPIYTQNGTFYTAFRLTKGTNWLGGLPRGRYIINNRHFSIN